MKQGDIILTNFTPQAGHEQAGQRPAVVISRAAFYGNTSFVIVCPITSTMRRFPLHIPLDSRTKTSGMILCEQMRTIDIEARGYTVLEQIPKDILQRVIKLVKAEIELE